MSSLLEELQAETARKLVASLREELAVANERVRQVQADYQYFVENGESRERAGSRRTLELVQNLAVRIVVATQAAGINGDSLRAWLTALATHPGPEVK